MHQKGSPLLHVYRCRDVMVGVYNRSSTPWRRPAVWQRLVSQDTSQGLESPRTSVRGLSLGLFEVLRPEYYQLLDFYMEIYLISVTQYKFELNTDLAAGLRSNPDRLYPLSMGAFAF
jgi:hypothetical protein